MNYLIDYLEVAILLLNFYLLYRLSGFFVGKGSDHAFYDYYIALIKANGNKFFNVFPNFINTTPITDPQFFFTFLSFLSEKQRQKVSLLLNPIVLTLLLTMAWISFGFYVHDHVSVFIPILIVIIALTPQYFHGQNSRIYGLSARGIGLLLVFVFLWCVFGVEQYGMGLNHYMIVGLFTAYLIWGVSLFAQQVIVLFSLVFPFVFGSFSMPLITLLSIVCFILLHPSYAINYFKNRWIYLVIYSRHLAAHFILRHRYSIWRDWVYDFWFKKEKRITTKFSYIYSNSFFMVIFLNPLFLLSILGYFHPVTFMNQAYNEIFLFSVRISIIALIILILTSFRFSRFLGEPERYVEIIIPFSSFAGLILIYHYGHEYLYWIIGYFILINAVQLTLFVFLRKHHVADISKQLPKLNEVLKAEEDMGKDIRLMSNNMDWIKFLLNTRWKFIYYYPTVFKIGKIHIDEMLTNYPILSPNATQSITVDLKINYLLIDKIHFEDWESNYPKNGAFDLIFDAETVCLLRLKN